jgi:RNA polymerase sigma factor (sigma-70 family)
MIRLARENPSKESERRARRAKQCLADSNARLVYKKANAAWKRYLNGKKNRPGTSLEDLIGAGRVGLSRALKDYDDLRGFKFSTYAIWWIRHYIQRLGYKISKVGNLPGSKISILMDVNKDISAIQAEDRKVTHDEMHEILVKHGIDEAEYNKIKSFDATAYSLDAPVFDDGSATVGDVLMCEDTSYGTTGQGDLNPESEALRSDTISTFNTILDELTPLQRSLVTMMYIEDNPMGANGEIKRTRASVRRELGVTKAKADKELNDALAILRREMTAAGYGPASGDWSNR